jgi:hypothetical protein
MHNGFHVVDTNNNSCGGGEGGASFAPTPSPLAHVTLHASLAYGVDWVCPPGVAGSGGCGSAASAGAGDGEGTSAEGVAPSGSTPQAVAHSLVASCSFYDRAFKVWSTTLRRPT